MSTWSASDEMSFGEAVAYHQRNAMLRDLGSLFGDSCSSPSVVSRTLSSTSSYSLRSDSFTLLDNLKFCQVQFKHLVRHYKLPENLNNIRVGEFVLVESFIDKFQEDMGIVTKIYDEETFLALRALEGPSQDDDENKIGKVLRIATLAERQFLPLKFQRESPLLASCQAFVKNAQLPMTVYGVEYQFDGKVLFVYYVSRNRVDFRPLVKFLIKTSCKGSRIQMKKTSQCRRFIPVPSATEALVTGQHCIRQSYL